MRVWHSVYLGRLHRNQLNHSATGRYIPVKDNGMNENVQVALTNYVLWLSWYPGDYAGATKFASDHIETVAEVDELEKQIKAVVK